MLRTAAIVLTATLFATLAIGCSSGPQAVQQAELKQAIETGIFTKFIDTGPSTDGKPVAFAAVTAKAGDANAVRCDYQDETGSGTVSLIVIRIEDTQPPTYQKLSAKAAFSLLYEATQYGAETYHTSEIVGNAKFHTAFPSDANGERHFLLSNCTT